MGSKVKIKYKILLSMSILVIISTSVFSVVLYRTHNQALLDGIDNKLLTAAYCIRNILPENYHDNIVDEHSVPKDDFDKIVDRNNKLCLKLNLQYIWSVMAVENQIVFTSATSPGKDIKKGDHAAFFEVHADPRAFDKAFDTKKIVFSSFENEWGLGRMVLIPGYDGKGRQYCFGVSMSVNDVNALVKKTMINAITIAMAVLLTGFTLSFILAHSFSVPITEITGAAKNIARGDFSRTVRTRGGFELSSLSESINAMAEAIRLKMQEVENQNTSLNQQIMERKKAEKALQSAHDDLDRRVQKRTIELNEANEQLRHEFAQKKKVEEEIRNSRDQFQSLVTNIPGITYRCELDKDWSMMFMSGDAEGISGYPATDFIDNSVRTFESIIHRDDSEHVNREVNKAVKAGEAWEIEYRLNHKDGSIGWVYEKGRGIAGGDGRVEFLDGFILDITDRKNAERKLVEAHTLFEGVIEQSPIPMVVALPDGQLKIFNEALIEQLGIDEGSGIRPGTNLFEMNPTWKDYGTDGELIPTEKLPLALALRGVAVRNLEVRVVRSDGTERWEIVNGTPIYDHEGNLIAGFVSFPDITELKQAEEALNKSMEKANRLVIEAEKANIAKSEFLANMSHELRTPLTSILGMSEALIEQVYGPLNEKQLDSLKHLNQSGGHLLNLINDILDLSKVGRACK